MFFLKDSCYYIFSDATCSNSLFPFKEKHKYVLQLWRHSCIRLQTQIIWSLDCSLYGRSIFRIEFYIQSLNINVLICQGKKHLLPSNDVLFIYFFCFRHYIISLLNGNIERRRSGFKGFTIGLSANSCLCLIYHIQINNYNTIFLCNG